MQLQAELLLRGAQRCLELRAERRRGLYELALKHLGQGGVVLCQSDCHTVLKRLHRTASRSSNSNILLLVLSVLLCRKLLLLLPPELLAQCQPRQVGGDADWRRLVASWLGKKRCSRS